MTRQLPAKHITTLWGLATLLCLFVLLLPTRLPAQEETGGRDLDGRIRIAGGGVPPRPIEVRLELHGMYVDRAVADSSGRFTFSGLGANSYTLVVDEADFLRASVVVTIYSASGGAVPAVITLQPREGDVEPPPAGEMGLADLVAALPDKARKEFEAGVKASEKGKTDEAIKRYRKTIELAPDFYPAHSSLGQQYLSQGNLKAAEEAFQETLKLKEEDPAACFGLGSVLLQTERYPEAEKTLKLGLEQDSRSALGHFLLGSVYFRTQRLSESEKEFRAALFLDPSMPLAQMGLIDLLLQQQRDREALEELKSFVEHFPDHPMLPQAKQMLRQLEDWLQSQSPR
jgi:hypothetical protein